MKKIYLLIISALLIGCLQSQVNIDGDKVTVNYDPNDQDKNIIRVHYLRAAVNGDATISYERYIAKYLSIELGAGITYNSILDPAYFYIFNVDQPDFFDRRAKVSYSFLAGVRLYLKEEFMDGLYVNPSYRLINYKINNRNRSINDNHNMVLNDLGLSVGYNLFYGNFHMDYFAGMGVRHAHVTWETTNNSNQAIEITQNKFMPLLLMGARFGFSF